MKRDQLTEKALKANAQIADLVRRLSEAEEALAAELTDQVDAIIDPGSAMPILLRQAQETLAASEARYYRLMTRLAAIIFELEPDGTILFVNEAITQITGYSVNEVTGRNWWQLFFTPERASEAQALSQRLQAGDVTGYELTLTAKNGSLVTLELNSANLYSNQGKLVKIVGLGIDITQRKHNERELTNYRDHLEELVTQRTAELEAARAAAEQANAFKLRFLAMISHELRTPLTSIKGFTSTLLAPDVHWESEQIQDFVQVIDMEADRLSELVEDLMDISRLQAGILRVTPERVAFGAVVEAARSRVQAVTLQHQLVLDIPDDLPEIEADPQRIAQVLVNLVENAAKYSPPGTQITVSARGTDSVMQVAVADEGPGIPPHVRENLFEPFRQLDQSSSNPQKGAGLGLAICKGLVEAHGGKIWIQDRPGPGATIAFTLPRPTGGTGSAG